MSKCDVILCVTLGGDLVRSTEHLGVSYIAAYLRQKNVSVNIVEIKDVADQKNIQIIVDEDPILLGFTVTVKNAIYAIEIAKYLKKERGFKGHVVAGGHMANFAGEDMLQTGFIDSVSIGEGEFTIFELWECLTLKKDWKTIDGLAYMDGNSAHYNPKRAVIEDLDALPFPVRDQFEQHPKDMQYLRICGTRGCYGTCSFCSAHEFFTDTQWRGRSPNNVVNEIEHLVKRYNIHTFDFVDSTFEDPPLLGKKRIEEIAKQIISRNLKIYYNCCFRAENWSEQDRNLIALLSNSGLEKVNIGFEGGNDRCLSLLNKRANSQDNQRVIKLLREFPEIYLTFGFLTFHPMITVEDLLDNVDFLYHTQIGQVSRHYFWKLEIYPGTKILEDTRAAGLLNGDYNPITGMYDYSFADKTVAKLDKQCRRFLDLKSVWDYEIFDIIIHTFIWRPLRLHPGNQDLISLLNYVNESRSRIAEYNHSLMHRIISGVNDAQLQREIKNLDHLLLSEMNKLDSKKLQCGMKLKKQGIEVPKR